MSHTARSASIRVMAALPVCLALAAACSHGRPAETGAAARSRHLQLREVLGSSRSGGSVESDVVARPFTAGVIRSDDPYRRRAGFAEAAPDAAGPLVTFEDTDGDGFYTPGTDVKYLLGPVRVSGRDVSSARAFVITTPGNQPSWEVEFALDGKGRSALAEATSEMVGRQLAIVVDGVVLSAPVVQARITQGRGMIAGGLDEHEAKALAAELSP